MRIFQHIDVFHEFDGIGNDILGIQEQFNSLGLENYIIARINSSSNKNIISFEKKIIFKRNDVHILHYGGHGYPIVDFLNFHGRKILRFHNITPLYFMKPYLREAIFNNLEQNYIKAKLELASLVTQCQSIWCDSDFNRITLQEWAGNIHKPMEVLPIVREYPVSESLKKEPRKLIFIGRWSPNKKIEDLVYVLYFLKKIHPDYKMIHIGKRNPFFQIYNEFLMNQIQELSLSEDFLIYENISETDRLRLLDESNAFLCMSEHEGFCIPVLEAMSRKCVVFAYDQNAVRETLNRSGVLLKEKDYLQIAFLIDYVLHNEKIKNQIIAQQGVALQRINSFDFSNSLKRFLGQAN